MKVSLIVPAAGTGSRMKSEVPKPFLRVGGKTVLEHTLSAFSGIDSIHEVIVPSTGPYREQILAAIASALPKAKGRVVDGGSERMFSVWNALRMVSPDSDLVAVHDAVRPFVSEKTIRDVIRTAEAQGAALPGLPVSDTLKKAGPDTRIRSTVDRNHVFTVQTPQVFRRDILMASYKKAINSDVFGTDESSLVEMAGFPVYLVEGNAENVKLTYPQDLILAERRMNSTTSDIRIGYGYDVHALAEGRRLVLGGVEIPHETGLLGHSDADVLLHAITDAILGALALGDIGTHFPDTSADFKDIDSRILLRKAVELISERGYRIRNLDATLLAEKPKIAPHVPMMKAAIAQDTGLSEDRISIKATTNEAMGFVGRKEGMAAMATALLSHA